MLSRMHSTIKEFRSSFESYELNKAAKTVRSFIVDDVSRFYMKIAKERISEGENADAALYTIYEVMLSSLKMLGCISPLICESLYQKFFRNFEDEESLFLLRLNAPEESVINALYEKHMETVKEVVSIALTARQTAGIKVRWPIRTLFIETKSHEAKDAVDAFMPMILSLVNVKEIRTTEEKPAGDMASAAFSKGTIHMDKKLDEALYEEGLLNEVKRRIQIMRKEAQLVESDKIALSISTEKEFETILGKQKAWLCESVNASGIKFALEKAMNDYTIDGRLVKISIAKD